MHSALQQHHDRILKPDVMTPFRDANDVLDRLLPYHVWQAPEKDLLTAMEARWTPPDDVQDWPVTFQVPYKRKRAQDECAEDTLYLPTFPTTEYSLRRAKLIKQFAALQTRVGTSHLRAPETNTSLEHLERMAYEDEMRNTQELSNELRRLRAQLEEVERQRNWRFGVPAAASLNPPPTDRNRAEWSSPWAARRFAAAPSGYASPSAGAGSTTSGSSVPLNTSPITRPYVANNPAMARAPVVAGSAASLPALTHAVVSHLANLTAGSASPVPSAPIPPPPQPLLSHADTKTPSIPTQPLPLVMPISAVPRLTALGINLVPAAHLIPALSLASAGQSIALNPGLTAPRPVVGVQEEPVLLVGITDAPHPGNGSGGSANVSRQRLHLSVVLAKLRAEQLSGLAVLMQTLQGEEAIALPGSNFKPT
ncbi:hypothetical protein MYAM1_000971 [Malassezia yamatoensis]|uniref:GLTSCR protein conserved domain-containing protein n=1 Tax=Malassezia yamatoensis TaxID=253288 RepID=A0AAJ6CHW3_9BASI|nr:hypothetical protein MYAM1_000971 [Malassezia yamatoensis]